MNVDVERLVCGMATTFGEPSIDGRPTHTADEFRAFVTVGVGLPLWVDHFPPMQAQVLSGYGSVLRFAMLESPPPDVPRGLLMLAVIDANPAGDGLLRSMERGQLNGLSIGGDGRPEVSFTDRPAYDRARVIGIGRDALAAWELLTLRSALDELAIVP